MADNLITLANRAGGRDNASCVVAQVLGESLAVPTEAAPPPRAQKVALAPRPSP